MKKILIILCSVSAMGIGNAALQEARNDEGSWSWLTDPAKENYFVKPTEPTGDYAWLTEPAKKPTFVSWSRT